MGRPIIAVCGKGGVGKTVFSALLSRILIDAGIQPLLLIDADPAGGLTSAVGEHVVGTLASARDKLNASGRKGEIAQGIDELDYLLLQALVERKSYSLLAMGHSVEEGCFYPASQFLRVAIDVLVSAFAAVLIDVEAGIEQINRDVIHRAERIIALVDGSQKSVETLRLIMDMVGGVPISVVANRVATKDSCPVPEGVELLGLVPENRTLRRFDREGRSLWELPLDNRAVLAVREIAQRLGLVTDNHNVHNGRIPVTLGLEDNGR